MEQEELIEKLKKRMKKWRILASVFLLLLIAAVGAGVFIWEKNRKPKEEPEEPAPTRMFLIASAEERVAAFNNEYKHCTAKLETILGWQYIVFEYSTGMKIGARNEYPIVEGTTDQADTGEKIFASVLSDGKTSRECRNDVTIRNIFDVAAKAPISFNGVEYLIFANDDRSYGFINLQTMEEAVSVDFEKVVAQYFELKDIGSDHVQLKAGSAEFTFHSTTHDVAFSGFQINYDSEAEYYRISSPVCLGQGEYIGYIDGVIVPSGERFAFIEPRFGAYVGFEYEDPESTKIIEPSAEPIENPVVLSATGTGRYYLPRYQNVSNHEYNWDNLLIRDDGFRELRDDEGNVISRMGIDISHHNNSHGDIDWKQVKAAGIDFAIIRLGYRGIGEGTLEPDKFAEQNVKGAAEAGLDIGVYFYTQAITEEEAIAEADYLIEKVKQYGTEIKLPLVIDTELYETKKTARGNLISRAQRTKCLKAFCERVEQAGYTPMVYASTRWSIMNYDRDELSKYPFWFAFYGEKVSYRFDFCIWQYTSEGKVPGITGDVDLDIMLMEPKME